MVFKKQKKKDEVAVVKEKKEVTKEEPKEATGADLLNMAEPERDYIYNMRIINELTAIRAAIIELTNEVKKEQ